MPEIILRDYEHSSGPVFTIAVPYANLNDATPTVGNPCEITGTLAGVEGCGAIMSIDANDSIAIINVAPAFIGYWNVRNVLTYVEEAEATWGTIAYGADIYYDDSATMPAGTYLSTSPNNNLGVANPRFGRIGTITAEAAALYPLGAATASTPRCHVMQRGAAI